jgi:uncharacterized protein (DUF1330 family)
MLTVGMEDQMVAYWVARSKVNNPDQYKKYTEQVPGILQKFGGRILARGGKFKILEGPEKFHRFVVIEFPSFEKALACHESAEYAFLEKASGTCQQPAPHGFRISPAQIAPVNER